MCQLFRDRCRDARRRHGALGAIGVSAVAFVDLATNAFLERVLSNRADLVSSSLPTPPRPASARPWPGETLMLDLRLAIRRLVHEPGFTAIVVITLRARHRRHDDDLQRHRRRAAAAAAAP